MLILAVNVLAVNFSLRPPPLLYIVSNRVFTFCIVSKVPRSVLFEVTPVMIPLAALRDRAVSVLAGDDFSAVLTSSGEVTPFLFFVS